MVLKVCRHCAEHIDGEIGDCEVCCNVFDAIPEIAARIAEKLSDYEFSTFQVGSRLRGSARAMLEFLRRSGVDYDLKRDVNNALSAEIARLTGKKRSAKPHVTVLLDLEDFSFEISVAPVFIYGRYKKRIRNISQTRWICRSCWGKGCELCSYTGRRYGTSVEELIASPVIEIFRAKDAILHGAGREDVDARMLGNGRPFVLEVIEPKKRFVDIGEVERAINEGCGGRVVVSELRYADGREIERVKEERHRKLYRAKVVFERSVSEDELRRALESLVGEIHQRTPRRVLHRRSDRLRIRRLHEAKLLLHRGSVAVIAFLADAGLYIKELVSGDEGRTRPSLSELLGCAAKVEKLDVLGVYSPGSDG